MSSQVGSVPCAPASPPDVRRWPPKNFAPIAPASPPDVRRWPPKNFAPIAPASPPDVRQGFALPVVLSEICLGLCPWFGLCPLRFRARGRTGGEAPSNFSNCYRQGEAP